MCFTHATTKLEWRHLVEATKNRSRNPCATIQMAGQWQLESHFLHAAFLKEVSYYLSEGQVISVFCLCFLCHSLFVLGHLSGNQIATAGTLRMLRCNSRMQLNGDTIGGMVTSKQARHLRPNALRTYRLQKSAQTCRVLSYTNEKTDKAQLRSCSGNHFKASREATAATRWNNLTSCGFKELVTSWTPATATIDVIIFAQRDG